MNFMDILLKQYNADELFLVEPREESQFAKKVTCKLCSSVLFDFEKDSADSLQLLFHGLRAHYQIWHDIMLAAPKPEDPNSGGHGP